jgi:rubredoxin
MKQASFGDIVNYPQAHSAAMAKQRMKCTICGWTYDPAIGAPKQGISPGVAFEALPEGFKCPKCGAMKKWFKLEI